MKKRLWKEKWIGNYAFYCGLLNTGDYQLGVSFGNKEGQVNLIFFTVGYMQ